MKWNSITSCLFLLLPALASSQVWNNPHPTNGASSIRYSAITGSPKTLDPAKAYSSEEINIISQIYEPILQYHYRKRPYKLVKLTARQLPSVSFYTASGQKITGKSQQNKIAYSVYQIQIQPGIYYQPHPAFAKGKNNHYLYLQLTQKQLTSIHGITEFKKRGSKELTADDYIYQIKRLASPKVNSPIFGFMRKHIVGFDQFNQRVQNKTQNQNTFVDLRQFKLSGVNKIDRYHFTIKIKGVYPQFIYWLAMPFFAPTPWQVDAFYSQPGMKERNITLGSYPVGTGPYMLIENDPNKQMVLISNPNFHYEAHPDKIKTPWHPKEKRLPFIEKIIFTLDKESIPRWNKFLQGYYDKSSIGADSFDQAIHLDNAGRPQLTQNMQAKGIRLQTTVEPGVYYIGFNMLDQTVGGYRKKNQLLRQAIAIAIDYEEYISIFLNGRGIPAQGPIPPGLFGYAKGKTGMNPYVYQWINGKPKRRSLSYAKRLLRKAGYPRGINPKTGKALLLNYDTATTGSPGDKAHFGWLRKQFAKLGINLNIRATLYNRFQDKVRSGKVQIFSWGWMADYPDPENFLFLLYSANGKVKYGGENATNYSNHKADQLFSQIRILPNGSERQEKINALLKIIRQDTPWIFGFHPINFTLSHKWNHLTKPNPMARNTLKYERLNAPLRTTSRHKWNQPIIWPFVAFGVFLLIIILPLIFVYRRRERGSAVKKINLSE